MDEEVGDIHAGEGVGERSGIEQIALDRSRRGSQPPRQVRRVAGETHHFVPGSLERAQQPATHVPRGTSEKNAGHQRV